MADSVIGAIRAILQLDTAAFSSGAKEAEDTLSRLSAKFTSTAKTLAAGLGVGLGAKAFVDSVNKMIDSADELGKASQKFGVPVEQLSALKFAADLADVSFESLGKGLAKLSKAILDGAVNPGGEAAKAFKSLGISVRDANGQIKPTDEIFGAIAEKFSQMEDGAGKTATAIKLFGRSGADLIPLLNEGQKGIKALTDEAKKLGIVISQETAAKAQEFNDTLKRIHTISDALYLKIAESLLPGLQKLANAFLQAKQDGGGLDDFVKGLGEVFDGFVQDVLRIQTGIANFGRVLSALMAVASAVPQGWAAVVEASKKLDQAVIDNKKNLDALNNSFLSLGKAGAFDSMDNLFQQIEKVRRGMGGLDEDALKVKQSLDKWIESQKRQADAQAAQNQIISQAAGVAEAARFQSELDNKLIEDKTKLIGEQIAKANEAKAAIVFAAQTAELKRFVEEGKSDWDRYIEKLDEVKARIAQFPKQATDLNKTLEKIQSDMRSNIAGSIATALGGFSQLFMAAAGSNKRLFEIGKAFAIAEATVNTFKAANQALTAPPGPPFSYIYVAGAIAAGIANVIKITQTKFTAAALGGRFRVPGGSMGVDTGIFPMKLAPGELVEVTPSNRAGGAGDSILNIPAINPRDFFSGDTVRYMVESIDRWMRDGGTGIRMAPR